MSFFFSKKEPRKDAAPTGDASHSCPPGASYCTEEQKPWERNAPLPRREWRIVGSGTMALLLVAATVLFVTQQQSSPPLPASIFDGGSFIDSEHSVDPFVDGPLSTVIPAYYLYGAVLVVIAIVLITAFRFVKRARRKS